MSSGISSGTSSLLATLKAKKAKKAGAQPPAPQAAETSPLPEPSPSPSSEPLGINPPEKDLPPPAPAKRGPGRPKKTVEAAVVDAIVSGEGVVAVPAEGPKQLELPFDYDRLAGLMVDHLVARLARAK